MGQSGYYSAINNNKMFSIIVIIFQAIAVLFIGIFARSTDSSVSTSSNGTSYSTLISDSLTLMLGFTFMYSPFRRLSIFALVSLLIVLAVAVQTNILFGTFWDSCFIGFSSSFQVTATLIIRSIFASLAVLLTVLDFMGLFDYWQVYLLLAPIMTIGFSLCSAIVIYGLNTFDGGGGYLVFLYSGVCSLMIWVMCVRGKVDSNRYRIKESYINHTLGFIGVVIAFINWPKFNMGGALVSSINSPAGVTSLQNSALPNTLLGLSAGILISILFASKQTKEEKLKYKIYIDGFINSGIVIASYQDILLNPVPCLILASLSTIVTLIVHKYFLTQSQTEAEGVFKIMMRSYGKIVYRILFSLIGSIIAAIVVSTRNGQSPRLTNYTYATIAGFQVLAWLLVAILAAIFGLLTGVAINVFLNSKKSELADKKDDKNETRYVTDEDFFQGFLNDQIHPLYYDVFQQVDKKQKQRINLAEYTSNIIKQSLMGAQDSPLKKMGHTKRNDTKPNPKEVRMLISKDYSKSNFKEDDVSKMKVFDNPMKEADEKSESNRQEEGVVVPDREMKVQKSRMIITESEVIPQAKQKGVRRKLQYDDDQDQIRRENFEKSHVRS